MARRSAKTQAFPMLEPVHATVRSTPLWAPSTERMATSNEADFIRYVQARAAQVKDHWSLYDWSLENKEEFWQLLWEYFGVLGDPGKVTLESPGNILRSQWFPEGKINFAENLLRCRSQKAALTEINHRGIAQTISYADLFNQVQNVAYFFKNTCGLKPGDVVAGLFTNSIACVVCCLAAAKIGAIWTACSTDFGLQAILDRFEQVKPKVLCSTTDLHKSKKTVEHRDKIESVLLSLDSVEYFLDSAEEVFPLSASCQQRSLNSIISSDQQDEPFERFSFNHPLYVLYSSGTTGKPKCIVHGAGGTLLQHLKELGLHTGLKNQEKILFYSSCGWMMWNWLVSGLALGAHIYLYDGPLLFPKPSRLFDIANEYDIHYLGLSPRYLQACEKAGVNFDKDDLRSLKTVLSTGSVLSPYLYDYFYSHIKSDVALQSISGGTDIISCFVLGSELLPVYAGEAQTPGFALDICAFDENGLPVIGEKGELVCRNSFVSKPIYFANDPEFTKYQSAYFSHFKDVWTHGDFIEVNDTRGITIYGRSDATLNPGGIRVGSAEIYRQVLCFDQVKDAVAVDYDRNGQSDIVLFIQLENADSFNNSLVREIKQRLRTNLSENHVPAVVLQAPDLPRTHSGKTVELAVKKLLAGEAVKNKSALANPESLDFFDGLKI